jgi:hypothetical protein
MEWVGSDMLYFGSYTNWGNRGHLEWNIVVSGNVGMNGPEMRGIGASAGALTITGTGRVTITSDLTCSVSFVNRGELLVADGKAFVPSTSGHQMNGTIYIGQGSRFNVRDGWSQWHGRIDIAANGHLSFTGAGPHDIGAVDFRMDETGYILMDNCQVRFVVTTILQVTNWRCWIDKSVVVTALVPMTLRVTKQFSHAPEAGICGGGDSCYGGGIYQGPGNIEWIGSAMTYRGSWTNWGSSGRMDWNITISGAVRMLSSMASH